MPSVSQKQHNFFERVLNTPGAVGQAKVSRSVAQEFVDADKRKGMSSGYRKSTNYKVGMVKQGKQSTGFKKNIKMETA